MRLNLFMAAAAIAALSAGAAAAQNAADQTNPPAAAGPASTDQPMAPSAGEAASPAAATTSNPNTVVESSPTPADQAYTLKAGDPNVVSNGPVPDTPQNRARYGPPMSNAGRHTAATGD